MEPFKGVIPPITTPFSRDGRLLFEGLESNFSRYRSSPVSGFLLLGSNGESAHLSSEEKRDIVALADMVVPSQQSIIVGIPAAGLRQALALIDDISQRRIDALLVGTPAYYKNRMTEEALTSYFTAIADRSPFPVLLYNVPQYSGIALPPSLIGRLAGHRSIVGMKESSGDVNYLQSILRATREHDFQILSGSAQVLAPVLTLGVEAAILAVACAFPELPHRVFQARERGHDLRDLQAQLHEVGTALTSRFGVAGVKHAMDRAGYYGGCCRSPLLPLSDDEKRELDALFERLPACRELVQAAAAGR